MTMDKILGNFLTQANKDFPLDCETLDYLQELAALAELAGNIAGDRVVLCGCEANADGTRRGEGYVFVRTQSRPEGEVMPWEGGPTTGGMYVKQEAVSVSANNTDYPKAYTRRSLAPGIGTENYSWDDFTDIRTIKELMDENRDLRAELAGLQPSPLGVVELWSGTEVPPGYALCDGRQLRAAEYPGLYAAIGTTFNTGVSASGTRYTTEAGSFRLPDLRGRFVAGQHDSDSDYQAKGSGGGKKKITLTERELPAHSHETKDYYYAESSTSAEGNYDIVKTNGQLGGYRTDRDNDALLWYKHQTENAGEGLAVDIRPPYYVLAYIMRLK